MKINSDFSATLEAWDNLLNSYPWSLFIYGGINSDKEDRCKAVKEKMASLSNIEMIGINRQGRKHYAYEFTVGNKIINCDETKDFQQVLEELISNQRHNILLDLTGLEMDIILNLLVTLSSIPVDNLFGIYLVPEEYSEKDQHRLELLSIAQPRGYISFEPGISHRPQDVAHYFLLGFDKGRADYFLDAYDWDLRQVHALIGDPSYVPNGIKKTEKANAWTKKLSLENIHRLDAHIAENIKFFFQDQMKRYKNLDIIPLGPKPMLLGVLLFYWQLPEKERSRVRLLYDFPAPTKGCTLKISHGYLYNCKGLIQRES